MTEILLGVIILFCTAKDNVDACVKAKLECAIPAYEKSGKQAVRIVADCLSTGYAKSGKTN